MTPLDYEDWDPYGGVDLTPSDDIEPDPDAETCWCCGIGYGAFRTGETFASVQVSMLTPSSDPSTWRNRRRNGVLGYWRELKRALWCDHQMTCNPKEDEDALRP